MTEAEAGGRRPQPGHPVGPAEAGSQAKHNSSLAIFEYVTGYHVKKGENSYLLFLHKHI